MGTEVLRPQDFWSDRFRLTTPAFHRRRSYYPNARYHRKPSLPRSERPDQRRKSPSPSPPPPPLSPPPQSQPQRELISIPTSSPAPLPRRSLSAYELQAYYYNRSGAPMNYSRVRIPRRRQSLDTIDATRMKRDMNRGGLMKKKYMDEDDVYAGSAFFVSPSPSSLPLPSFFNNTTTTAINNSKIMGNDQIHDLATRDLRRLLRLE